MNTEQVITMANTAKFERISGWKFDASTKTIILGLVDTHKREVRIQMPRQVIEAALPMIAQDFARLKTRGDIDVYTNAKGLEIRLDKTTGILGLNFDLATGTPFRMQLPAGAAQGLLDGLREALEARVNARPRVH